MEISRIISRITLGLAFSIAFVISVLAFFIRGTDKTETWTVAAAALAVITSVISAWSSRRTLELQEDAQKPNVFPSFDLHSRHQVALLRVSNVGATAAHNISLEWNTDLTNNSNKKIGFFKIDNIPAIPVLLPKESITQFIDVHHGFIGRHPDHEYSGKIFFEDVSKRNYTREFRLDARPYAMTPSYDKEDSRTHYQLQKIPEELSKIRELLQKTSRP